LLVRAFLDFQRNCQVIGGVRIGAPEAAFSEAVYDAINICRARSTGCGVDFTLRGVTSAGPRKLKCGLTSDHTLKRLKMKSYPRFRLPCQ
jgi:hypothetical protein